MLSACYDSIEYEVIGSCFVMRSILETKVFQIPEFVSMMMVKPLYVYLKSLKFLKLNNDDWHLKIATKLVKKPTN